MRKEALITRTIKEVEVSVLCYDREQCCEVMEEFTLTVLPDSKQFESVVKSRIKEGLVALEIANINVKETKYGCTVTEFLSVAHEIPSKEAEETEEEE